MAIMLTDNVPLTQIADGQWLTRGNQLYFLDNGKIAYLPRDFKTDNITFISCDFADVRCAHLHDEGCRYHEIIYTTLTLPQLKKMGYLKRNEDEEIICEDIPACYLFVEKVSFNEINNIFKQCLLACGENVVKTNIMRFAVNFNFSWLWTGRKHIDLKKLYTREIW